MSVALKVLATLFALGYVWAMWAEQFRKLWLFWGLMFVPPEAYAVVFNLPTLSSQARFLMYYPLAGGLLMGTLFWLTIHFTKLANKPWLNVAVAAVGVVWGALVMRRKKDA